MKKANSEGFDQNHPLLADSDRLDQIADVMYAKIQKILFRWRKPVRRPRAEAIESDDVGEIERILNGNGFSADDVLSEALIGLLQFSPEHLHGTWEGLAVTIAENKAKDALTASRKRLRGTEHRPQLYLVSGDIEREGPDGETEPAIFDTFPSNWGDPEAEFFKLDDALKLRNLAREVLDEEEGAAPPRLDPVDSGHPGMRHARHRPRFEPERFEAGRRGSRERLDRHAPLEAHVAR